MQSCVFPILASILVLVAGMVLAQLPAEIPGSLTLLRKQIDFFTRT
jgi:hypothetical protein